MSGSEGSDDDYDTDSPYEYVSSCDSSEEEEDELSELPAASPWTQTLGDEEVASRVVALCAMACCKRACFSESQDRLEKFVYSTNEMNKEARKTALLTALAISAHTDVGSRHRGQGQRTRYSYLLPFCGIVCKRAFQAAYDVSNETLATARSRIGQGYAFVAPHKNNQNNHSGSIDHGIITAWFRGVATKIGEPHPVRFRRQRKSDGVVVRYTTRQNVTFLPAFLTWNSLFVEFQTYLMEKFPEVETPSYSSFYRTLTKNCSDIRIASPRSNVCDICAVYRVFGSRTPSTLESENQAAHAMDAHSMRSQYAKDAGLVGSKHFLTTIDFAKNIALTHVASTPSAWYFLSLIGVSLFGLYSENTKRQDNYVYSERVAGKGSNEVVSMLHDFAIRSKIYGDLPGTASWTIYADNCGGQNKNNHLIRYLRFLVDTKRLRTASQCFFVKGHTKNHCDRGFGQIKRAYARKDIYTMDQVTAVVNESAETNSCVCLEDSEGVFLHWKSALIPVYRDIKKIQSYQLFNFPSSTPGMVLCRKRPNAPFTEQQILKNTSQDWGPVWSSLQYLPKCGANPEKVTDLNKKILPYIPDEFKSCDLYREPTNDERAATQQKKRSRMKSTPTMAERLAAATN